ncbi:hypothetical protein [Ralstonia sp.]|uniref:hypothetical protein n=1 Tax=Ralstonia sp. TaxID=54061 RepID=UPI0031DF1F1F
MGHSSVILPAQNTSCERHNRAGWNILINVATNQYAGEIFSGVVGIVKRTAHKARKCRRCKQTGEAATGFMQCQKKWVGGNENAMEYPAFSALCFSKGTTMIHNMVMRRNFASLASWVSSPLWNRSTRSRDFNPRLVN